MYLEMFNNAGDGWEGAKLVISPEIESERKLAEDDLTFTLDSGRTGLKIFTLENGCYNMQVTASSRNQEISWKIFQVFEGGIIIMVKERSEKDNLAFQGWLCTAGERSSFHDCGVDEDWVSSSNVTCNDLRSNGCSLDQLEAGEGERNCPGVCDMNCADQEKTIETMKTLGLLSTPSPTATPSSSNEMVIPAVAAGLGVLVVFVVGLAVHTRRKKGNAGAADEDEDEDVSPFDTDVPMSPPTLKVIRSFDGRR